MRPALTLRSIETILPFETRDDDLVLKATIVMAPYESIQDYVLISGKAGTEPCHHRLNIIVADRRTLEIRQIVLTHDEEEPAHLAKSRVHASDLKMILLQSGHDQDLVEGLLSTLGEVAQVDAGIRQTSRTILADREVLMDLHDRIGETISKVETVRARHLLEDLRILIRGHVDR